jgi:hypothetical protein
VRHTKKEQEMRSLKQLSSLKYLGLAIRGHDEKEGNLMQLLKLRGEDDSQLQTWLSDGKYLSTISLMSKLN